MKVTIALKEFEVRPLTLKSLKLLAEKDYLAKLSTISGNLSADQVEAVIQTVAVALQRSHPEVTAQWVEDNLEVQDIGSVLGAVMEASGFKTSSEKKAESK